MWKSITVSILVTWLVACGAQRRKPPAIEQVRYLPAPAPKPCLRKAPPEAPKPPACLLTATPSCVPTDEMEYLAALLDHREKLALWAHVWWKACGPS